MKKLLLLIAALVLPLAALSQDYSGGLKSTVVNRDGKVPVKGALVQLYLGGEKLAEATTGEDGTFLFSNLKNAVYTLEISAPDFMTARINAAVEKGFVRDLVFVSLTATAPTKQEVDDSNFAEFDLQDTGYSDSPIILFGTNDPFNNIASYGFSSIRYKNRGYNSETQDVLLSGVELNDAITGFSPYSLWSGLNEAMRAKETTIGVEASDYALGRFNGTTNILATPVSVRPGWRFSALTNSALYRLRLMGSYATGQLDNGWSFAFNVSARVGGNDWVKGVFYRSFAFYAGAQKNWDNVHNLSLVVFAAPGERGAQNASTQEVYDLMGDNMYNSNWGYQNGKIRNSRVRKTFEPVTVLKYSFTPDDRFALNAALLWRTGKNGYTALDWYDANDPRPDYYRNLPSYYSMDDEDYDRNSEVLSLWAKESWNPRVKSYSKYQHLDWDHLYDVNRNNPDGRSKYAQEERHVDQNDLHAVLNASYAFGNLFTLKGGVHGRLNRTENYKLINDLLGGQYYLNIDSFAERDFAASIAKLQNDLDYYVANGEAEKIVKGGKYGYDYLAQVRNITAWANGIFNIGSFNASLGGSIGYDSFWRDGLVRKGLFAGTQQEIDQLNEQLKQRGLTPDLKYNGQTSKGKSAVSSFLEYSGKATLEYHFAGAHRVYANVGYFNEAPTFAASFISPRTRNTLMDNLTTKKTFATDLNYQYSSDALDLRLTGYYTTIKDGTDVMSFYDDSQKSFTNFAMTGIDERHAGVELGFRVSLPIPSLSLEGALAWGEHIYTGTPHMKQTIDNSAETVGEADVTYWSKHPIFKKVLVDGQLVYDQDLDGNYIVSRYEKHYVPSSPQLATELALKYNYDYWFFEVNGQYFAKAYLDMNPLYRVDGAVAGPDRKITPTEIEYMTSQESLYGDKGKFLLNASIGKSWYINRTYNIGFSLNVSNILNDKNFKTGGYEQTRLVTSAQKDRYLRFDSKYFYMQGINYMLNVYFRF